jgi:hypothetical protein
MVFSLGDATLKFDIALMAWWRWQGVAEKIRALVRIRGKQPIALSFSWARNYLLLSSACIFLSE